MVEVESFFRRAYAELGHPLGEQSGGHERPLGLHARLQHGEVAYPGRRVSVDGFLYVRAAVIAKGQVHYEKVLSSPKQLDPEVDFEPLLSLAAAAFESKMQKPFDYFPPVSYETYTNEKGWE